MSVALALLIDVAKTSAATASGSFSADANGTVLALAIQTDGKIIAGGTFTSIAGTTRPYLARLNPNGSLDTSFSSAALPAQPVNAVAVVGGKIYAAAGDGLRRFSTDGTADWQYPVAVKSFAVDASGRVIAGGQFTRLDNQYHRNLARLLSNGSLDSGFTATIGCCAGDGTFALLARGNGVVAGGMFQTVNGTIGTANITSINEDSSVDGSFNGSADATVLALVAGPNGTFLRVSERTIARHLASGALDPAFTVLQTSSGDDRFTTAAVGGDGSAIVGGQFTIGSAGNVARLRGDGTLDSSFGIQPDGAVQAIAFQADGNLLLGGSFTHVNGAPHAGLVRVELGTVGPSAVAPTLKIAPAGAGQIVISWPTPAGSYSLQAKAVTESAWNPVATAVASTNGISYIIDSASAAGKLYRLKAQP